MSLGTESFSAGAGDLAYATYDRTTSRWGRITMLVALAFSVAGPLYLVFGTDLEFTSNGLLIAFLAVAAVYGVIWVIEPLTYYPVLGPAAMYQAFMIGNIANKLVPSAIVAQQTIGAKPGTRRAEFSAVMAISGAAIVHIVSLLVFVGLLGTWLISLLPTAVVDVARDYIFPAIIGAVVVQLAAYAKQPRITVIALVVALVIQVLLAPYLGQMFSNFATALVVLFTVVLSWLLRDRRGQTAPQPDA
ncbi:hypothetical protein J4H86_07000 [Spiractinospora alimapuensis]|uniref:hypothetical protein n=1 Tax=Spiractinospora alimapuensis TaxID=2820884 RepID=UPI001F473962|nr:hypothetical protein [Spiractinospora alimapuensis]QVQ53492.1 hypothetical protein J4H86_07000 [Spiractinospora alimapuensis]